jgi:hypothetical protein
VDIAAELPGIQPNPLRHRMRKLGIAFGRRAKVARKGKALGGGPS